MEIRAPTLHVLGLWSLSFIPSLPPFTRINVWVAGLADSFFLGLLRSFTSSILYQLILFYLFPSRTIFPLYPYSFWLRVHSLFSLSSSAAKSFFWAIFVHIVFLFVIRPLIQTSFYAAAQPPLLFFLTSSPLYHGGSLLRKTLPSNVIFRQLFLFHRLFCSPSTLWKCSFSFFLLFGNPCVSFPLASYPFFCQDCAAH